jgi:hypothetical protein
VLRATNVFVRCGKHDGSSLEIAACDVIFVEPLDVVWASDQFGLRVDLLARPDA